MGEKKKLKGKTQPLRGKAKKATARAAGPGVTQALSQTDGDKGKA